MEFMKPHLDTMLKCYLSLMMEFDDETLIGAFDGVMDIFADDIKEYATYICLHLSKQYLRCIQAGGKQ